MTLWLVLAAHFIADFTLQPADWAKKKTQKFRYLLGHALVYALVVALTFFLSVPSASAWLPSCIIAFSHFVVDWIRVYADRKKRTPLSLFTSFLADQTSHILIVFAVVYSFRLNNQTSSWLSNIALHFPLESTIRYALIFIIIMDPASVFVKKLSIYVSGKTSFNDSKEEPPVGSVIGKLERLIITILVLCNEIGAIGFVLTAKSLARYKQLDKQDFAEKYLIGTLSSTAIAIIVTLLLK